MTLTVFVVAVLVLVAILAFSRTWTPKLGLDLRGGTTITLTAANSTGTGGVDQASLQQAQTIIEQRVNSLGVGEASITIVGNNQIQVSVPNVQGDQLVEMVGQTAQLEFRRVYQVDTASAAPAEGQATELPTPPDISPVLSVTSTADPLTALPAAGATVTFSFTVTNGGTLDASGLSLASSSFTGTGTLSAITCPSTDLAAGASTTCTATYAVTADDVTAGTLTATVVATATGPNSTASVSSQSSSVTVPTTSDQAGRLALLTQQLAWTPSDSDTTNFGNFQCGDTVPQVWDQPFFACLRDDIATANGGNSKYLLGPRLLEGNLVTSAAAGIPQNSVSWIVTLNFNSLGAALFSQATGTLAGATSPTDQFAIVLDGKVISAPSVNEKIPDGSAEITGNFTQDTATNLANVLKYGALPLSFELSNVDTVSATLGGDQLTAGLIAGAIGLLLVVVYSVIYYRGLGIVVFTSLLMALGLTYVLVVLLGESMSFALSLPGLAGVIVAIGVTADSFIIYFERVRDEAREGRSIRTAVETGWDKARRTIVVADMVSLLSAVILYILSIGTVKGFAFTLGLTTIVDLIMIFFFTKPMVSLLVRTNFFGTGRRGSGFEAEHLGIAATRRPRPRALATVKEA